MSTCGRSSKPFGRMLVQPAAQRTTKRWKLLQRFQILVFDYSALHSANEELAAERAARVLHPDDLTKASVLWKHLVELAIASAANGGERDKARVTNDLREFRLAGDPRNLAVRQALRLQRGTRWQTLATALVTWRWPERNGSPASMRPLIKAAMLKSVVMPGSANPLS